MTVTYKFSEMANNPPTPMHIIVRLETGKHKELLGTSANVLKH